MDKKKGKLKRGMGILLAVAMLFNTLPISGFAVSALEKQETGLCEHHVEHTAECGYTEAQPCTHEHTDECYEIVMECVHTHTDECYPEVEETEEGSTTPSDVEIREPVNCSHQCSEESGCISRTLDCHHEHGGNCGYVPAEPCAYVCGICDGTELENARDNAKETDIDTEETENTELEDTGLCTHHLEHIDCGYVQDDPGQPCGFVCRICPIEDLIAALPRWVTEANRAEVEAQLQEILALYAELTEDQEDLIDLSTCWNLQAALDEANAPAPIDEPTEGAVARVEKEGEEPAYVTNLADAFAQENSGATITLLENVELSNCIQINSGSFTLNLNGYTINGPDNNAAIVLNGANLTICGSGNIRNSVNTVYLMAGTLTMEGGTFSSSGENNQGLYASGGTLHITGSEVTVDRLAVSSSAQAVLSAGTYTGNPAITAYGRSATLGGLLDDNCAYYQNGSPIKREDLPGYDGTLYATVLTGPVTVGECTHPQVLKDQGDGTHGGNCPYCGTEIAAESHTLGVGNLCGGCGTALVAQVETSEGATIYLGESDFAKAFDIYYNYNNVTITLLSDIQADSIEMGDTQASVHVLNTSTLDLAGHTITSSDTAIYVYPTGTLTIKDSSSGKTGQVVSTDGAAILTQTSMVSLMGGTYTGGPTIDGKSSSTDVSSLLANYGTQTTPHYAYFDAQGNPIELEENQRELTDTVTVKECTHPGVKGTSNNNGTHSLKCSYCGFTEDVANCTYGTEYKHDDTYHWQTCTVCQGTTTPEAHYLLVKADEPVNGVTQNREACDQCDFTKNPFTVTVTVPSGLTYGNTVGIKPSYTVSTEKTFNIVQLVLEDGEGNMEVMTGDTLPDNLSAGSYKLYLSGGVLGNPEPVFRGRAYFTVAPAQLTVDMIKLSPESITYSGAEQKPTITVKQGETTLTDGTDYDVTYSTDDFTNAGTITVTITGKGNYTGTVETTYTIKKATPEIAWETATQELAYTGKTDDIYKPTVTLVNGETFSGTINYSYAVGDSTSYTSGLPTNAGTYTIKASVAANGNYTAADSTNMLALTIGKAQGTLTVQETSIEKTFGDAEFSLNCSTNGDGKISYTSSNENVASVSSDGSILIKGAGETIITVFLAEGTNHTGGAKATVTVTVTKAAAPTIINETRNYTYTNGSNGAVTIDVAGKLPKDCGETLYTFTTTDENSILSNVTMDNDGNLKYTVLGNKLEGDIASITVTAKMANYENAAYTVNIELVAKKVVEPQTGSSVSVKGSNILTYGQTLSDLTLDSVIFVEQGTNTEVKGTLAWKAPSDVPTVATGTAEWVFTPEDGDEYAELTGMVAITVVKATPEVEEPAVDAVTYHPSRTLGSVGLTSGSTTWTVGKSPVTVEGTWSWKDASAVPSVGNSGYTAVFTPKDTANYNTVECTVAVPVEKAVPHIAVPPTAVQITYGDALDASALTGGTAQYSGSDNTAVAGSFAWKDSTIKPAVSDSGSTEYTVVFTPTDSTNYSSVETKITLTVEQAENAPNMPSAAMNVARKCEKVSDVELPEGWKWQDADKDTALEIGIPVTATAVYAGADRDNYKNVAVAVAITRLKCDHKNTELRNVAAATCQKKGYSGDTYCLDCGELLAKGAETELADHSGGTATCISGKICVVCGAEYSGKNSGNHTHTEIRGAVEATCTADGYTGDTYCTGCKAKTGTGTVIHATGHDWHVTSEEAATTTSEGRRIYTCSECRQTREESIPKLPQPSHTHSYSARETKAATCTENGVITYSCSCGDSYTQNTASLGHSYRSEVTKQPTRSETGIRTYTCTRCGSTYMESIPKLPEDVHTHSYKGSVTKKATCTETGIKTYTCACGDSYTRTIPAQGHNYTHEVTTEPTTSKAGVRTYTCTRCGNSYTESIPKLPSEDHKHDYSVTVVKEAACTEAGVKRYACACGDSYTESIPALGHSYISKVTQEPTVSAEGVMTYTCTRCGDSYTKPIGRLADTPSEPGSRSESRKPFIKDESSKEGWTVIKEETDKEVDGSTVTVDMNGSTVVPGDVLEHIRGRDITIVFDMGNDITWSVNGKNVKGGEISDIDFSVQTDTEKIPEDKVASIAGERYSIQVSLAHEGEFGFTAVLSINLGKENAGLYARLFYYNESTGELEIAARAERIADDGSVSLAFTHASEYVIVVGDEAGREDISSSAPVEIPESGGAGGSDQSPQIGQPWRPWWIMVVGALVIIIGIGAFFVIRKKKEEESSR